MDDKKRESVIGVWKTVVDVQMHFNDIEMKIRSLFVTIVLALAAAEGFLIDKALSFSFGPVRVLYATFIPLLGILGASLFYFMDRYWYHRLLMGAVKQGAFIEDTYAEELPELGLTAKIGDESPVDVAKWTSWPGLLGKRVADVSSTGLTVDPCCDGANNFVGVIFPGKLEYFSERGPLDFLFAYKIGRTWFSLFCTIQSAK